MSVGNHFIQRGTCLVISNFMAVNNPQEIYVDSHTREIQENTRKLRYIWEVHKKTDKM